MFQGERRNSKNIILGKPVMFEDESTQHRQIVSVLKAGITLPRADRDPTARANTKKITFPSPPSLLKVKGIFATKAAYLYEPVCIVLKKSLKTLLRLWKIDFKENY